jgi:hypothetical protein
MTTLTSPAPAGGPLTIPTWELTRDEAIDLHRDNIKAIDGEITRVDAGPDDEHTARALASLRRSRADEAELIELARCEQYPYQLKDDHDGR